MQTSWSRDALPASDLGPLQQRARRAVPVRVLQHLAERVRHAVLPGVANIGLEQSERVVADEVAAGVVKVLRRRVARSELAESAAAARERRGARHTRTEGHGARGDVLSENALRALELELSAARRAVAAAVAAISGIFSRGIPVVQ